MDKKLSGQLISDSYVQKSKLPQRTNMELDKTQIEQLRALIGCSDRIVITTHHNPDGDAIGSSLGLQHILSTMGVSSEVVTPNGIPEFLMWLPGAKNVTRYTRDRTKGSKLIQNAELLFCLDFNGYSRTELMKEELETSKAFKVLIDHHPNPQNGFNIAFSSTQVSSTAELVYEVATLLFGKNCLTKDAAECIFAGIMTDTGSFSYACNRPRTFAVASELLALGVKIDQQQSLIYNNFSEARMRMVGYCLAEKMKVFPKYKTAYIVLTIEEQKRFNHQIGDTEGLVNYPLSIKGIAFSALFIEREDFIKVSLRSRGTFPVNELSGKYYNGGGHTNAAGGKSFKPLDQTIAEFEQLIAQIDDERLMGYKNIYK